MTYGGRAHCVLMYRNDLTGIAAPCCASWPRWLCANTHKRNTPEFGIFGDESHYFVQNGNQTALVLSWLLQYLHFRDVFILVEQPEDSLQSTHPSMEFAYSIIQPEKMHTWLGAFGNIIMKPTYFWTTMNPDIAQELLVTWPVYPYSWGR